MENEREGKLKWICSISFIEFSREIGMRLFGNHLFSKIPSNMTQDAVFMLEYEVKEGILMEVGKCVDVDENC